MTERVNVKVVAGTIRHPVTMYKIEDGDEVDYSPAIARLVKSGQLEIIAAKPTKKTEG